MRHLDVHRADTIPRALTNSVRSRANGAVDSLDPRKETDWPALFDAYWGQLVRYARSLGWAWMHSPAHDSEEIAQDALFRAHKSRAKFDPEKGTVRTWLLFITTNVVKDARAKTARLDSRFVDLQDDAHCEDVPDIDHEVHDRMRQALRCLSSRERLVLQLAAERRLKDVWQALGFHSYEAARTFACRRRAKARRKYQTLIDESRGH